MLVRRLVTITFVALFVTASWTSNSFAGTKLYEGRWIAESFANDKVGIGTEASLYFEVNAVPLGAMCHAYNPRCDLTSTPVTTAGAGTVWNPLGPGCRALTAGELPRPAKGGTATTGNGANIPPLYRNTIHFTAGGARMTTSCPDYQTHSGGNAKAYIAPFATGYYGARGVAQYGAPVIGSGSATTTAPGNAKAFKFPAALATAGAGNGMRRETSGSFVGSGNYLYSYTYADLRNDAGDFGPGKGFFSTAAAATKATFYAGSAPDIYGTVNVKRGKNRFGGVMKLLGTYNNKVCYFASGGCGLGYNTWYYQSIGAAGAGKAGGVVTQSFTKTWTFTYFNTGIASTAYYTGVAQRFPWTTGSVTVNATYRGYEDTYVQRKGFDNRDSAGVGTVQLVSPILTQWLSLDPGGAFTDTGGVAVMQIKFAPEPGGIASLIAGLSMLVVLHRSRR